MSVQIEISTICIYAQIEQIEYAVLLKAGAKLSVTCNMAKCNETVGEVVKKWTCISRVNQEGIWR